MFARLKTQPIFIDVHAAYLLLLTALGHGEDADRASVREWMATGPIGGMHPMRPKELCDWVGSPGASESVAAWMQTVLKKLAEEQAFVERIHFTTYIATPPGAPEHHHQIMVEATIDIGRIGNEYILCSGMTDYSGSGGAAAQLVEKFIFCMVDMFAATREVIGLSWEQFHKAELAHSEAIQMDKEMHDPALNE